MSATPDNIKGEVVLFAKLYPKPGTGPQFIEWMNKLKAYAKNEPGTLEYSWAQNGDEILIWERYADAAAFETHRTNEVCTAFSASGVLKAEPTVIFYPGEVKGNF